MLEYLFNKVAVAAPMAPTGVAEIRYESVSHKRFSLKIITWKKY